MVLFHFIFELFKIAILASLYATITWLLLILIGKNNPSSWFERVSEKKSNFWFKYGLIISIFLFLNMFSYWGDHGLGDSARIPIGYDKSVYQTDGTCTYIKPEGYEYETLSIGEYAVADGFLFAKASRALWEKRGEIIVWNLKTNQEEFLKYSSDIEEYKTKNEVDELLQFQDFQHHYSSYWNGWRFWLFA